MKYQVSFKFQLKFVEIVVRVRTEAIIVFMFSFEDLNLKKEKSFLRYERWNTCVKFQVRLLRVRFRK